MLVRDYIAISVKNNARQPIRSILTILALAISATILVALTSISVSAREAITEQLGLDSSLSTIVVTPNIDTSGGMLGGNVQTVNSNAEKLDASTVETLAAIPGVQSITSRVSVPELRDFNVAGTDKQFVSTVNALDTSSSADVEISEGSYFKPSENDHAVILGQSYAQELGYGDDTGELLERIVTFNTRPGYRGEGAELPPLRATAAQIEDFNNTSTAITAKIVGIASDGLHRNQLLVAMDWAQKLKSPAYWEQGVLKRKDLIQEDGFTSMLVQARQAAQVESIAEQIESMGYGVVSTQEQIERIDQLTLIMWAVLGSVALISLISACLGIANTMFMAISEERYAIGVWRASGARKRLIATLFLAQAALLGLVGGILGVAVGRAVSGFVNQKIETLLQSQGSVSVNLPSPTLTLLCGALGLTILISMLSALFPSVQAARQDPSLTLGSL
jgi:putative ABC transport system permease protein